MRLLKGISLLGVLWLGFLLSSCTENGDRQTDNEHQIDLSLYPKTRKGEVVDRYFDTPVADPYRWLEDDMSPETEAWVRAQNAVTFGYLNKIPYRENVKKRIETLWNYEKVGAPFKEGAYTYFYKNSGLQNQYVVYRIRGNGEPEVFLDPNTFNGEGTTSLSTLSFSQDGSLAAYSISEAGSDWRKIIIINAETKQPLEDPIIDAKFSGIAWNGQDGFYYSSYDKPEGSRLSAKTDQHKLYYHRLGTAQQEDLVIFGGTPDQKRRYVGGDVTEDGRYLVISGAVSTSGNDLYLKDLTMPNAPLVTILDDTNSETYVIDNVGTELYIVTDRDAPNQRMVRVDAANPRPEKWEDVIAETEYVLSASTGGGYFFAKYMVDAMSKVYQYDYQGNQLREIKLPGMGSASSIGGKREETKLYYSFTNYSTPPTIFELDLQGNTSAVFKASGAKFSSGDYISSQHFYTSKGDVQIPMMITHKKGLVLDGKNPTILYGYGGFNISLTPSFSIANAFWLEQGGVYAVPNLRGGGEYGKQWHDAGTQLNKQNVFDDFIAAAEYLVDTNYTSRNYLAINGRSNGGLLVGAVMTQRPDLIGVALPGVGVMDMLRYHRFTAGAGWAYDYGTSEQNPEMFEYLKGYSPVHNVRQGVQYPATMITTGDHDDRVVPAHSFKFAAELQAKQSGQNPILIRIETNAGHGAGTPVAKIIQQYADKFSFTFFNMGFNKLPVTVEE
ncbi:MAG: prolyl oligopeptidase family serine peptidase [Proteobacteria bacterium]|nr:prolyl oligopeptidase family serine peptidase [Pseudomonadota bacterium]MDA1351612.1 prolyl oligopeptidase family serine peptidase [Pseudomonadota bacterium]